MILITTSERGVLLYFRRILCVAEPHKLDVEKKEKTIIQVLNEPRKHSYHSGIPLSFPITR